MAALRNRTPRALAIAGSVVLLGVGFFWLHSLTLADRVALAVLPAASLLWAIYDHGYQKGRADAQRGRSPKAAR
jgi:hypothetical protein